MKWLFHIVCFAAMFFLVSCKNTTSPFALDPDGFEKMIRDQPEAVLLDVRTKEEFDSGYICNAVNMDYYRDFSGQLGRLDKDKTYLVYCRRGRRSADAAQIMRDSGFSKVYELKDGLNGWRSAGKATDCQ